MYDHETAIKAAPELRRNNGLCTINCYAEIACKDWYTATKELVSTAKKMNCSLPGKGMTLGQHISCMQALGIRFRELDIDTVRRMGKTVKTFSEYTRGSGKSYVMYTSGHVLPIINGRVHDWTEGRRHRPYKVYEVIGFKK